MTYIYKHMLKNVSVINIHEIFPFYVVKDDTELKKKLFMQRKIAICQIIRLLPSIIIIEKCYKLMLLSILLYLNNNS